MPRNIPNRYKRHKKTQFFARLNRRWLRYEYKHTTVALSLVVLFIAFLDSTAVNTVLGLMEQLGYLGAFLTGALSVSFFTAVPAIVLLIDLADKFDPIALAIVAGAGAMVGDWLLLSLFEDRIGKELAPILRKLKIDKLVKRMRRPATKWILVLVGIIAIITPIPDEAGLALLGLSRVRKIYLLPICFVLDTLGMLGVVMTVRLVS